MNLIQKFRNFLDFIDDYKTITDSSCPYFITKHSWI